MTSLVNMYANHDTVYVNNTKYKDDQNMEADSSSDSGLTAR